MRRLMIALLSLALAGCWIGEGLYADGDARLAITPGIYRASTPDQPPQETRVTILPNGMTQMTGKDATDVYGFVPLDTQGKFAVWFNDKDQKGSPKPIQMYFLGMARADGSFVLYIPECAGAEGEIARHAGAVVEQNSSATACKFSSRASLEGALRQLQPTDLTQAQVLTLVKQ